ncbi:Sensor histidine kinase YpdA [bioreactor metagenome]|uniref:Sensor histidine kinase YpdA n=1 Tax=bioreactor metagenome TaxID=1076179 RepID=A0A645HKX3_9ZZZZ
MEKARFGDKLNVIYDIDEDINIKIPSLIIQPIVENSVKHGILEGSKRGTVKIYVKKITNNKAKVIIEDDGVGISEKVIERVYNDNMQENKIGISNVNKRLKYLYGKGLQMERLDKGTRTTFIVETLKG